MNQISLYNKSTDSKLSIEAEELTRSRNIKIPKDGSFLLTNKTRLTEELAPKYTVGPTGDFQELEEAVRVLCNMKEYSSRQKDVIVELQENYVFKPYRQFSMNAGFIVVRPKSPITLNVTDFVAIFNINRGAISPRFERFTMNITATNTRLFDVIHHSVLVFDSCTFNFDYQDTRESLIAYPLFLHYDHSTLVMTNTVINMSINKNNNTVLNKGRPLYRNLSTCGENSNTIISNVKINIEDKSNKNDSSKTSVFRASYQARAEFIGSASSLSYSEDHGSFLLACSFANSRLTIGEGLTVTGNFNSGNQNSTLIEANTMGSITCEAITLKDCGTSINPIRYSFEVNNGGMINISNYQNDNSYVTNEANITVNTLTRNGVIYK